MNADTGANHEGTRKQPDSAATADEFASDLSLTLMYLSSWKERPDEALRFWKGFSFGILNQLAEQELIHDSRRAKSDWDDWQVEGRARQTHGGGAHVVSGARLIPRGCPPHVEQR